jgi:magnesium-protoporphyrin O-methyltransferase
MPRSCGEIEKAIADEFNASACEFICRYKKDGLSKSSRIMMNWLIEHGLGGRNLLDLGCGAGTFSVEALKNGASTCVGIDLAPEMIMAADSLAAEMGLSTRAKFHLGNAASEELPPAEVVVMDKVICCYPELDSLLKNASSSSREIVCCVVPRDQGLWKWPLRLAARTGNLIYRLRRRKLNWFYIHSLKAIDGFLREAGFAREKTAPSRMWLALLYKRRPAEGPISEFRPAIE